MNADKLKDIIQRKNDELERDAVRTAEELIEDIVELTDGIAQAQKLIGEKRLALGALEIKSIDAATVLGKE